MPGEPAAVGETDVVEDTVSEGGMPRGPWEHLLGGEDTMSVATTVAAAVVPKKQQLAVPGVGGPLVATEQRRKSDSSLLQSFRRSFRMSIGGTGTKGVGHNHVFSRYRQSRFNARRIRKRVVFKHGDCNVVQENVAKRRRRYLQDIFTTLVDAQWRWTLFVFAMNFILSWLGFAIIWWLIAITHGDLTAEHQSTNATWQPCVTNINSFTSCFLFSVETQHTIGFGSRGTTEECPEAIFVMCLQSIAGVFIQAFMVGIVFAKLSRPKKRTQTLLFSRNAVICQRDGLPCLMFRVGDMRRSHIIEAHVRAQLIRHKITREGEHLPFFQTELKVGGDGEEDKIFFIWPTTIVHKIDKTSPLYKMSATDLLRERFEIVVILEGVIESTGMTTQARSSYLPSEILWGHRFESLVSFKKDSGEYQVDYALFNNTKEVDTPLCSAKQLDDHRAIFNGDDDGIDRLTTPGFFDQTRTHSSDTLDLCSMDSLSLEDKDDEYHSGHHNHHHHHHHHQQPEHIEIRVPLNPIPVTITAPDGESGANGSCLQNGLTHLGREIKALWKSTTTTITMMMKLGSSMEDELDSPGSIPPSVQSRLFTATPFATAPGGTEDIPDGSGNFEDAPRFGGIESPLLIRRSQLFAMNPDLARVSTCNSSLTQDQFIGRQDSNRSRLRPGAFRKIRRRAVFKNGDCNILQSRISKRRIRFLQDIFTTLVDTQWRWTLLVFALSFLLSWLGFAVIWWLISFTHGDLEPEHLPSHQEETGWIPCIHNIYSFTSCFLFSIETQHTIGYGSRSTSEECPEAIFIMCLQSIAGVMIQAFMVGIVFAKMTRPKHRTQTLLFSRNAVICQRDGQLCLMFRVGDMRKSHIIGASIRAQLIRPKATKEGEILNQFQTELAVSADGCDGDLFFIWPMTVVHKIDAESPLYQLSAGDMLQDRLEIVVILEGTIESTGQTTQARSSYISSEILWGHRFEQVVSYNKDRQGYEVDYSRFDNTITVDTPLCSGSDLAEFYRLQDDFRSEDGKLDPGTIPNDVKTFQFNNDNSDIEEADESLIIQASMDEETSSYESGEDKAISGE